MARVLALTFFMLLTLTGCMRGSRAPELAALLKVAPQLMQDAPATGPLPPDQWPVELKAFDPERVYATPDGLYIVTSTFFAEEKGLFLPRQRAFSAALGKDPEFRQIVDGLYSYEIKG